MLLFVADGGRMWTESVWLRMWTESVWLRMWTESVWLRMCTESVWLRMWTASVWLRMWTESVCHRIGTGVQLGKKKHTVPCIEENFVTGWRIVSLKGGLCSIS
jgi:hypothetical protein